MRHARFRFSTSLRAVSLSRLFELRKQWITRQNTKGKMPRSMLPQAELLGQLKVIFKSFLWFVLTFNLGKLSGTVSVDDLAGAVEVQKPGSGYELKIVTSPLQSACCSKNMLRKKIVDYHFTFADDTSRLSCLTSLRNAVQGRELNGTDHIPCSQ